MRGLGLLAMVVTLAVAFGCTPTPPAETVCRDFARLKNAKDPAANNLLGPAPVLPTEAVSPEEAQRLQTEFFLRGDYEITDVWSQSAPAAGATPPVILVTKGDPQVLRLQIRTPTGVDVVNRSLLNPDLMVEVRDGKIYGVRSDVHTDRNQRPMTKAEAERLREKLGLPPQR